MSDWKKIDLWPDGPAGVEARYRVQGGVCYCFIRGSDHWADWLHHILPGAYGREVLAGILVAKKLMDIHCDQYVIGGHSLGGVIAIICADTLGKHVKLFTFGTKRDKIKVNTGTHYRHRGDIVPFLPPWMPKIECEVFGEWMPFWKAHEPKQYYELMEKVGLR